MTRGRIATARPVNTACRSRAYRDRIHGVFCVGLPTSRCRLIEKLGGKYETRTRMVLDTFEARKQAGEDPASLEFHEITQKDGAQYFRYMKAIPTHAGCLACHGEDISPEVKAELDVPAILIVAFVSWLGTQKNAIEHVASDPPGISVRKAAFRIAVDVQYPEDQG